MKARVGSRAHYRADYVMRRAGFQSTSVSPLLCGFGQTYSFLGSDFLAVTTGRWISMEFLLV